MNCSGKILTALDGSWANFSQSWKKARAKHSEKSIHRLRVGTRRIIAIVELIQRLSKRGDRTKLQRSFKRVFKATGSLRDVQVQIKLLAQIGDSEPLLEFRRLLERRERRRADAVTKGLTPKLRRALKRNVRTLRSGFVRRQDALSDERIEIAVARLFRVRWNEFFRARSRFKPSDEHTLHAMRIALKKLRYVAEAGEPFLDDSIKDQARHLQVLQHLLGESRDNELLGAALEHWANKRGRKIAIVPALETLKLNREKLLQEVLASPALVEESKPLLEKTVAIGAAGPAAVKTVK